jgi:hypothetical protein
MRGFFPAVRMTRFEVGALLPTSVAVRLRLRWGTRGFGAVDRRTREVRGFFPALRMTSVSSRRGWYGLNFGGNGRILGGAGEFVPSLVCEPCAYRQKWRKR